MPFVEITHLPNFVMVEKFRPKHGNNPIFKKHLQSWQYSILKVFPGRKSNKGFTVIEVSSLYLDEFFDLYNTDRDFDHPKTQEMLYGLKELYSPDRTALVRSRGLYNNVTCRFEYEQITFDYQH